MIYKRLDGECDDALILRVCNDKDLIGSWNDVKNILNSLLGTDYGESAFRKKYAAFKQIFEANRDTLTDSSEDLKRIREEQRRLEIEKVKFRDERNAWSRQNRIQARTEERLDNLEEELKAIGRVEFPITKSVAVKPCGKTLVVMLSDLHIGAEFDNYFGSYNTDIAKQRLGQLLDEVLVIAKRHGADECYVVLCGDLISGAIHHSIQVTNRENVIEQIKQASELVSSFCYELTKVFNMVTMVSVDGNHSRLSDKDHSLHDERADQLIPFCVRMSLSHVKNFCCCDEANIDSGIAIFTVMGKPYVAVHGDYDSFSKTGIQNLISMIRVIPTAVFMGHKHYCAVDEMNGVVMVQSGSLCGCGGQFEIEKRLRSKPSQMVCVCGDTGIECYYPIILD